MKRVLITGANGFLGQHLSVYLAKNGYDVVATGRGACRIPQQYHHGLLYADADLTSVASVKLLVDTFEPSVVVHAAAMSKPDVCNLNQEECLSINVGATSNLLAYSFNHFVYVSTDFIFGENGPHGEDAQPEPLNIYGRSKLLAEQEVRKTSIPYTILRPVLMYGTVWEGMKPDFLYWVKQNLSEGKRIKVVSDQQRTPTYIGDICKGVDRIIQQKATGDFHLAGRDILSPYDMAIATAKALNLNETLIEQVTAETFTEPVKRAKRSGLKIDKARNLLNYEPVSFAEGLRLTFNNLP
ncbi:SDR family oxidoreductase [Segetibacter sp. 3557_3]|uniref:SDR family oxidoreductase n=1 Tax=Segetibacter sp. 3557_3 TaxID=2547429 RepID=UPI0010591F2B|nr:SDR family oxidoreductase [Segetibacter sp. 3557_3]TDH28521.1 SDR family oxidoreductase [Segetibacter sp. 3557_3]